MTLTRPDVVCEAKGACNARGLDRPCDRKLSAVGVRRKSTNDAAAQAFTDYRIKEAWFDYWNVQTNRMHIVSHVMSLHRMLHKHAHFVDSTEHASIQTLCWLCPREKLASAVCAVL